MNRYGEYCLLLTLALTSVLPTLWGTFAFDDNEAILNNDDVKGETSIPQLFTNDFWGTNLTHRESHKSYRPLIVLIYRLEYYLWGRNPFPFHLLNWIIHGINCILLFQFQINCFSLVVQRNPLLQEKNIILGSSILYAVHPIHVEAVGALVGRADLLSAFICVTGFILLNDAHTKNPTKYTLSSIALAVISIVACLFKENVIVLSVFRPLLKLSFERPINRLEAFNLLLVTVISIIFIRWRLWFQDGVPVFQEYDNPPVFAKTYFSKVASILYIWMLNVTILVFPIWLCFDWSMGCVPVIESISDPRFGLLIIFIFCIISLFMVFISRRNVFFGVGLVIGALTFLPSSNLIFTVGFVIAERNLYLSSIGFCMISSYSCLKVTKSKALFALLVGIFWIRSVQRSLDWTNQYNLFTSALKVCPKNAKVHYNIATVFGDHGQIKEAIESYRFAIGLKPDYYQAMNNLGNVLRASNELEKAENWLRKAISIKEDFPAAWMNLGIVLSKKNGSESLYAYQKALSYRRIYPDCEYNIGNLFLETERTTLAFKAWNRTISLQPRHIQSWLNIIILLEKENRLLEAKEYGRKSLLIFGNSEHSLYFLMGNIHGRLNEFEEAKKSFLKAIDICRSKGHQIPAKYWSNLGVLYHRWKQLSDARYCYEEALNIDPRMTSALTNLKMLNKAAKRH